MKQGHTTIGFVAALATVASFVLTGACGDSVPLGNIHSDSAMPGTGGGNGTGGSAADARLGTGGGSGGAGGALVADAPIGTGGGAGGIIGQTGGRVGTGGVSTGMGGVLASGGAVGTGGKLGTGGAISSGGSTGKTCGTIAGLGCSAGEFCDFPACGSIPDGAGVCRPTGASVGCTADWVPVCGCDGKTYSNDCTRMAQGVLKAADGACVGGTGGRTGTGGSGGGPGTGGIHMDGGAPGSGGRTGLGGATGTGGSTACGGPTATSCQTGLFCDLASNCGQIANATGTCRLTGASLGCTADVNPVCGCDGKTYSNDCVRAVAGMLKASDGECPARDGGAQLYPTAYLVWRAPGGVAGTGPAVVVSGAGWANTWDNTPGFSPETPPSSATGTYTLTSAQTDDLFARLAAVNMSSLPHKSSVSYECYPSLYFRLCQGCTVITKDYSSPLDLTPEMDPVWLWFDRFLGASAMTNPRAYCNWDL